MNIWEGTVKDDLVVDLHDEGIFAPLESLVRTEAVHSTRQHSTSFPHHIHLLLRDNAVFLLQSLDLDRWDPNS